MIEVDATPQTSQSRTPLSVPTSMTTHFNPLLITFLLKKANGDLQVRCRGCREIIPLPQRPSDHVKGVIELDGHSIPVVDAGVRFGAKQTELGHCSCILVVEHEHHAIAFRTGIVVRDIDAVMQLAAGLLDTAPETQTSVNAHFAVEMCTNPGPHEWLAEAHRDMSC